MVYYLICIQREFYIYSEHMKIRETRLIIINENINEEHNFLCNYFLLLFTVYNKEFIHSFIQNLKNVLFFIF